MGGHKAGEIASRLAIDKISAFLKNSKHSITSVIKAQDTIIEAINTSNKEIFEYSKQVEGCVGMGTTVTLAYVFKNKIIIGHVGDSRAYIIRNGGIAQLTEDHSLVNQLLKDGKISRQQFVDLVPTTTAKNTGFGHRKGHIGVGYDADIVVYDPDVKSTISNETIL